ncbi:MAG: T9SS type A sorting domain-containing protein [Candidatus Zophobacter franzmannii]|nr:T9SS type A sorting domain-containing protein [Candidatus Zophobacter franzmannii]
MKRTLLLLIMLTGLTILFAQMVTINGNVMVATPNSGFIEIVGAEISVGGATESVASDPNGFYSITFEWLWDGPVTVGCTAEGYNDQSVTFMPESNTVTIDFELSAQTTILHTVSGLITYEDFGGMMLPVVGADITVTETNVTVTSDEMGFYTTTFDWIWNGPVVIDYSAEGFHEQTLTFFPDSQDYTLGVLMIPLEQPEPTIIEGYVRMAYPNNDQPVVGAVLTFGDGVQELTTAESTLNGFYNISLIWNWWGPIYITCHYPGFNHVTMEYLPDSSINTLNFFMQELPPIFNSPTDLTGDLTPSNVANLQWVAPQNWPLDTNPTYRVYLRNDSASLFHAIAETTELFHSFTFTPDQSGYWSGELVVTAFVEDIETSYSNAIMLGVAVENSENILSNEPILVTNYPNPFNPLTNISLNIPTPQMISIKIYNIKGQEVKQLVQGYFPEGKTILTWDGKDSKNHSVSSGVYLVKINCENDKNYTQKITLIK